MAEYHESFGEDVGSKLLMLAAFLVLFGVIALILLPLGTAFAPAPPPAPDAAAAAPAGGGIVGALMPGIITIIAGLVFGVIAGLLLGAAKARHETQPPPPTPH